MIFAISTVAIAVSIATTYLDQRSAWYAVISTEILNDLSSLTQPGSILPHWVSRSFFINSLN